MAKSKEWAVKLRPQTLEQMAGQESNKLIIQSWIDNDNLPNALIFYGKSGTGKALKNGTKEIVDLRKHFDNRDKDEFYLGLIDTEPEW